MPHEGSETMVDRRWRRTAAVVVILLLVLALLGLGVGGLWASLPTGS